MLSREKHFTIRQLERIWQINYHTLRRWFIRADGSIEPGVIISGTGRKNRHLEIPESVAQRVYERHLGKGRAA